MKTTTSQSTDTSIALATKRAFLEASRRKNHTAPIRPAFVQRGERGHAQPGLLATLVRNHDQLALDLQLLLYAKASAPPYTVHLHTAVWTRLLGLAEADATSRSRISKAWARLEQLSLIVRGRCKRLADIGLLLEDGSGDRYTRPRSEDPDEVYFGLDFAYWLDEWDMKLSLPAKAVLLIALSLKDGFILPTERGKDWYGLSADTIDRGLRELRKVGLLTCSTKRKPALLSPAGYTLEYRYWRQPPFGPGKAAT